jgi:peptide/nickel transport system substrate-binding protein
MVFVEPGQYQEFQNRPFKEGRNSVILQASHDNNFGDPVFSVSFKYGCDGQTAAMCDKKFDAEVERVSQLGGEERIKGWQEIFRFLYEDEVASIMMFHQIGFTRVNPRIDFKPDVTTNAEVRGEEFHFVKK